MQQNSSCQVGEVYVKYNYTIPQTDLYKMSNSASVEHYLRDRIYDAGTLAFREEAYLILLNRANNVIGWYRLSIGGITSTVVDCRIIMNIAVACSATAIILTHNHPSGNLQPSVADITITEKIKYCCQMFEIKLLDHVILSESGFYSFTDHGII